MRFEIPFGAAKLPLTIPDHNLLAVLEPNRLEPAHDVVAEVGRAAEAAATFARGHRRILILVNDYTRATPNALLLDTLAPMLAGHDVSCLICLGTHRAPTEDELLKVLGPGFLGTHRDRVAFHDSRSRDGLYAAGATPAGTEVSYNRRLRDADAVIAVNSVEPHYFAGFTGGRKTFLPGIAGIDTISRNHSFVTRPGSAPFSLAGNPVHEDMDAALDLVDRPVYSVQFVLGPGHAVDSVHHGDIRASFEAGAARSREVYGVPVAERADIIVSVLVPPYDINFYQSQRAVEFARPALKQGGVQVTVSACRNGIGNAGFIEVFEGCKSAGDVLDCMEGDQRFGWHKSARLAQIMAEADLYTVVGIEDETVRQVFMQPFKTVQEAFDLALNRCGEDAKVYFIPDAGGVVPVLTS